MSPAERAGRAAAALWLDRRAPKYADQYGRRVSFYRHFALLGSDDAELVAAVKLATRRLRAQARLEDNRARVRLYFHRLNRLGVAIYPDGAWRSDCHGRVAWFFAAIRREWSRPGA